MIDGVLLPAGAQHGTQDPPATYKNSYFPFFFTLSSKTGKRMIDGMLLPGFALDEYRT